MNMHHPQPMTELQRQHLAHKERQQRLSNPLMTVKEARELRSAVSEAQEEIETLNEALASSAKTIQNLIMVRSDLEALILIQAQRICQLERITAKPDDGRRSVIEIIKEVLVDYPGVSVHDVCGIKRSVAIVEPRHLAMAKVYEERPDLSLGEIGKHFGGRDHTTVQSAVKKMGVWRGGAE